MNNRHKKSCRVLNYIDHLLIVTSTITWCVSISDFDSLVGVTKRITSSGIGLKICAIAAWIRKYKSIIKKKKKKHDKIVLLRKSKLNSLEVSISKALIDSNNEFVLINNVVKEFYNMKEEIKNSYSK